MSPARWFVVTSIFGDTLMRGIIGWEETFISSPRWFVVTSIFGDALMRGIIGWEETFMSPPRWFVVTFIFGDALMRGIRCSAGGIRYNHPAGSSLHSGFHVHCSRNSILAIEIAVGCLNSGGTKEDLAPSCQLAPPCRRFAWLEHSLMQHRYCFFSCLIKSLTPIVYTIQSNPKISEHYCIDSIVCLANCKHLSEHLDEKKTESAVHLLIKFLD
eukprot:scaffold7846_cov240-Chaetoceros_neogracile.AAC.5